jgi:tetratricopeptide (TPR) repeat protein
VIQEDAVKPEFLVHIGQSKTGTSSIQRVLGGQRAALARLGICYPTSPGWANHGMLPASLVPLSRLGHFNPALWDGIGAEARLAQFRRDFAAEMAGLPATTRLVILSAEQCGGLLGDEEEVARLRDLLAPYASRIRVVVYLRRQDQHAASSYSQSLRVAAIHPPTLPQHGPERLRHYDYRRLLDRWAKVFGEAAMVVRIFDRARLVNGDAVDDFLALCAAPLAVPADHPDRQSNLSVTSAGIDLMRAMGERLKARPEGLTAASLLWRRFSNAVSDALPGRGWQPHPAEAAAFLARFAESNEAVRRRWFPDQPSLFAPILVPPDAPPPPPGPPPIDQAAALEAACQVLEDQLDAAARQEAEHFVQLGRLHERLGEAGPAANAFRSALRVLPDHPLAHQHLAEAAIRAGRREAAAPHLAVLRRAHPDHPATRRIEQLLG